MRKFAVGWMTVLFLALGSGSAFAEAGQIDTKDQAASVDIGTDFKTRLNTSTDVDWYVLKNRSSSDLNFSFSLFQPSSDLNYDVLAVLKTPFGESEMQVGDNGPGMMDSFSGGLAPGWEIYFKVYGHTPNDYAADKFYNITVQKR